MELIFICGMPASGKTTLVNNIRSLLGKFSGKRFKLLDYEEYPSCVVFGKFDGSMFDGTDRLSMGVQPDAVEFLITNKKNVLIEGDRLFTLSFIQACKDLGYNISLFVTECSEFEIIDRFKKRGQIQSEKFLKGRLTKLSNITKYVNYTMINTSKKDQEYHDIVNEIKSRLI